MSFPRTFGADQLGLVVYLFQSIIKFSYLLVTVVFDFQLFFHRIKSFMIIDFQLFHIYVSKYQ